MKQFNKEKINTVRRGAKRASYDRDLVYQILDSNFVAHLACQFEGVPVVLPTAYGRQGDRIYIHGSTKNRTLLSLLEQPQVCLHVSAIDGIVLARSLFSHSLNYRSVNVYGKASIIESDAEKTAALEVITENIIPDRWSEARLPSQAELDRTLVVAIEIERASAKVRNSGAEDDKEDLNLDVWAGVLELQMQPGRLFRNTDCSNDLPEPPSALKFSLPGHPPEM